MSKTTGNLTLDRWKALKVGYRVQPSANYGLSEEEGVLISIYRTTLNSRFLCKVRYSDGREVDYRPNQLNLSGFMDYPTIEDFLKGSPQSAGVHAWVVDREDNYAYCGFCGRIRVYDFEVNSRACSGPARISLR